MSNQQSLQIAIRAINESQRVMKEIQEDMARMGDQAADSARDLNKIEDALKAAEKEAGGFNEKLGAVGETGGDAESALRGVGDITTFMGEQMGVSLGPVSEMGFAFADLGGGIESLVRGAPGMFKAVMAIPAALGPAIASAWAHVTALYAQAAAFIVANAPMLLMIAAIAAIVAGIVLLVMHWDTVKSAMEPAVDFIKDVAIGVFDALTAAAGAVVGFLRDHWPEVAALISGPFFPIVALATDAFGVRSALIGAIQGALDFIANIGGSFWEAMKNVGTNIVNGIENGLGAVGDAVGRAFGGAYNAIVAALGPVVWLINKFIDAYNLIPLLPDIPHISLGGGGGGRSMVGSPGGSTFNPFPGPVQGPELPLQGPELPAYDTGTAYVPRTGLAIVHQGERIIPASQNRGGGGGVHIHLAPGAYVQDMDALARALRREFARSMA